MPQTEELYIVGLNEAKGRQIVKLFIGEVQGAEVINLSIDFFTHFLCKSNALVAALEQIYTVQVGVLMEHYLVHVKLIEVGIKQGHDTRG
jgi:hypothetical protein